MAQPLSFDGVTVESVQLGIGKHGLSLATTIDANIGAVTQVLSSSGLPIPNDGAGLKDLDVKVSLSYEKSRGKSSAKAYVAIVRIVLTGSLKLSDILSVASELPDGFDPELEQIELSLELDKSQVSTLKGDTGGTGGGAKTTTTDSATIITFSMAFANAGSKSTDQCILEGFHETLVKTSGTSQNTYRMLGGSITSSDGKGFNLDFGSDFPLDIDMQSLFLSKVTVTPKGKTKPSLSVGVFGLEASLDVDFNLSEIPAIGKFLKDVALDFKGLRLVYASQEIHGSDLSTLNGLLDQINIAPVNTPRSATSNKGQTADTLDKGFTVQGQITLGNDAKAIPLFTSFQQQPTAGANGGKGGETGGSEQTTSAKSLPAANPTPTLVGKKFGPVVIQAINLGLDSGELKLQFTGGLALSVLQFELIQFAVESPLTKFSPSFSLQGLELAVNKPPLTMTGIMEKTSITLPGLSNAITGYAGDLKIGYKEYGLDVMASFANLPDGNPSFFLYGAFEGVLGGPAFAVVDGLAAGFGYNRDLTIPQVQDIDSCPLIWPVLPNANTTDFTAMNTNFMPDEHEDWLAAGVRINSFKMVDTFLLFVVKFGNDLEFDLLGHSNIQVPFDESGSKAALAKFEIGLVASYKPAEGVLSINGQFLPGSYVLSPQATITGGFGLLTFFKEPPEGLYGDAQEGDFILSIGGYGPLFSPKSWYPSVPRLAMNWQVSNDLSIKQSAYFAIVPHTLMFGGHLQGHFHAGGDFSIDVNFHVGADFLICWKPYHYQGDMSAGLDVSARIDVDCWLFSIHASVDFDISADLNIWGPSFSGHASVHVHVLVSFTVGISFGSGLPMQMPIAFDSFSSSLLPPADKTVQSSITAGIHPDSPKDRLAVNAKELAITCKTAIPLVNASANNQITVGASSANFGVKPMAMTEADITKSCLGVTITRKVEGKPVELDSTALNDFVFVPSCSNVPSALWQPADPKTPGVIPETNPDRSLMKLMTGLDITTKPPTPGTETKIDASGWDDIAAVQAPAVGACNYAGFSLPTVKQAS